MPSYNHISSVFSVFLAFNCMVRIVYFYSVQYFHVLQDSKRYLTHTTVLVQPNSQVTKIPPTERQKVKDDHLSLKFFNPLLGIGPNDTELLF